MRVQQLGEWFERNWSLSIRVLIVVTALLASGLVAPTAHVVVEQVDGLTQRLFDQLAQVQAAALVTSSSDDDQ